MERTFEKNSEIKFYINDKQSLIKTTYVYGK